MASAQFTPPTRIPLPEEEVVRALRTYAPAWVAFTRRGVVAAEDDIVELYRRIRHLDEPVYVTLSEQPWAVRQRFRPWRILNRVTRRAGRWKRPARLVAAMAQEPPP